jgi:hypothetical protein
VVDVADTVRTSVRTHVARRKRLPPLQSGVRQVFVSGRCLRRPGGTEMEVSLGGQSL